ncbi:MAG: 50S ribosomal protein L9 [Acidimicrobiales bacterium]|nr:MAG: 50S ribosomal protein L9 [Acidimicrobiales bacterium]
MRVLLRNDVAGLGRRGDLVDVADGYGRNYLIPKGLAVKATPGIEAQAESMRRAREAREAQARAAAEEIASRLVTERIIVKARSGAEGKLFGSVTTSDIAEAILEQTGLEIDRRSLRSDPIRSVGVHTVTAHLHAEVEFPLTVEVVPLG